MLAFDTDEGNANALLTFAATSDDLDPDYIVCAERGLMYAFVDTSKGGGASYGQEKWD